MPCQVKTLIFLHFINVENNLKDRWHFIDKKITSSLSKRITYIYKDIFFLFIIFYATHVKRFTFTQFHFNMRIINYTNLMVCIIISNLCRNLLEDDWFVDSVCASGGERSLCAVWKCPVVWPRGSTETPRATTHPEVQGWHQFPTLRTGLEGVQDPTR